jgi:DNA/RNA-binding domain of Phe-tRNA-synthetase-like protein
MPGSRLCIDPEIGQLFPGAEVGIVEVTGIDNGTAGGAALDEHRRRVVDRVKVEFATREVATHPVIAAWRAAYRAFGTDPTRRRPAVEALVRRVVAGRELPQISPAVDAYLVAELEQLVPFGGYDADALSGDVVLRRSPGGELFVAVGDSEPSHTDPGEVVYADDARVLTRHWNHRDCDDAKITPESTRIVLICEVLPGTGSTRECGGRAADLVVEACGGDASVEVQMVPA